jgi:hypothetical protein
MTQNKSFICNDFFCLKCDFKCNKKGDWNRHILTQKHTAEHLVKNIKPIIKKIIVIINPKMLRFLINLIFLILLILKIIKIIKIFQAS